MVRQIKEINDFLELIPANKFEVFGIRYHSRGDAEVDDILPPSMHSAEWLREIGEEVEEDVVLEGTAAFEVGLDREGLHYDASSAYRLAKQLQRFNQGERGQLLLLGGRRTSDVLPEADEYGITIHNAQVLAILD